jgi:uncharacterized protein with HEPN domain
LKQPLEYLKHIRDECEYLVNVTRGLTLDGYKNDKTLKRAVERSMEIIGEASKRVPDDFKQAHPEIGWKEMAGMRDVLIHGYLGVDDKIVWDVLNNHIPPLLKKVRDIIK